MEGNKYDKKISQSYIIIKGNYLFIVKMLDYYLDTLIKMSYIIIYYYGYLYAVGIAGVYKIYNNIINRLYLYKR